MGLGWATNKNSGSEGMASEVLVIQLVQTSKHVGMVLIPDVADNNQPVPQTKVGSKWLRAGGRNRRSTIVS